MGKIIYKNTYFQIRVKDVVYTMIILFLLFFCFKGCQNLHEEQQKEHKISQTCQFMNENINDFQDLLNRADFCSEGWLKDLKSYMKRIEDQNVKLERRESERELWKLQKEFLVALEELYKFKDVDNVGELEDIFTEYRTYYKDHCTGGTNHGAMEEK